MVCFFPELSCSVDVLTDGDVTAGIPHESRSRTEVVFLPLLPEVNQIFFFFFSSSAVSVYYWVREDWMDFEARSYSDG